jgi:hypothetical protein
MCILSRLQNQRQRTFAGVRSLLKAALVGFGLKLMGSSCTGRIATVLVQRTFTAVVRRARLAGV